MIEHILSAIGEGLGAGVKAHQWKKEQEQKKALELLDAEIRKIVAQTAKEGRVESAGIAGTARVESAGIAADGSARVATINNDGAMSRHLTPSGDAQLREDGADRRLERNLGFAYDELFTKDDTDRWKHRTASGNAQLAAETDRYGINVNSADRRFTHSTPSGNAVLGANVSFRGQDMDSADRRYGIDVGARTAGAAEEGRNTRFRLGEAGRDRRNRERYVGPEDAAATGSTTNVPAPSFSPIPVTPRSQSMSTVPLTTPASVVPEPGTPRPPQEPVSPPSTGVAPPAAPDAQAARAQALATTLAAALQRLQTTTDPQARKAALAEVIRIRQQIVQAKAGKQ